METERISAIISNCLKYIEHEEFMSYDPYDALTNPVVDCITSPFNILRRAAIQINVKSPINLRWSGMKKMVHTKTVSDLLYYYSIKKEQGPALNGVAGTYNKKIGQLFDMLVSLKVPHVYAWGLNYPYTSRFINARADTPNLYNTVNSGISICYSMNRQDAVNRKKSVEVLKGILDFLETRMWFSVKNDQGWYQYYPGQDYPTYNVNALVLYLLVFIQRNTCIEHPDLNSRIKSLTDLLCEGQQSDGSWIYARSGKGKWIDGFHTGFILESLAFAHKEKTGSPDLKSALYRGTDYYIRNFFTDDFYVKYYPDSSIYPIDAQNYAQAIQTLSVMGDYGILKKDDLLKGIITNSIKHLYNERGYFYHQKRSLYTIRTPYFRWSMTPMILALEYANRYFMK